jgi:glycosyltransferase involved in cell wall biosynthesis
MQVSVVIPTYYRPDDLTELFRSLLKQIVKPFEVIIIDDTPTDTIKAVCEKYRTKFKRINIELVYVRNPRKRSAAVAKNVGAEKARGDIILFFDSDVILYANYVKKIVEVFKQNFQAIGVQGWITNLGKGKLYYPFQVYNKIFHLIHNTKNTCKLFEYPLEPQKIISCEWLSGANMAFKRSIFGEFQFDEKLTGHSYMDDDLFSHSIFQKYPGSLFMTPYAKCVHKTSLEGRIQSQKLDTHHKNMCRKYALTTLFGSRGLFIYYRRARGN